MVSPGWMAGPYPDFQAVRMAARTENPTWKRSRYSSLKYGVMIEDVLPSKGERCIYRDRCLVAGKQSTRRLCVAGEACPMESLLLCQFIESAKKRYLYARA